MSAGWKEEPARIVANRRCLLKNAIRSPTLFNDLFPTNFVLDGYKPAFFLLI